MDFARAIDNSVFPTAVGPVNMIKGFIHTPRLLNDTFELLLKFSFCHGNDSRTAMGTGIGIFRLQ